MPMPRLQSDDKGRERQYWLLTKGEKDEDEEKMRAFSLSLSLSLSLFLSFAALTNVSCNPVYIRLNLWVSVNPVDWLNFLSPGSRVRPGQMGQRTFEFTLALSKVYSAFSQRLSSSYWSALSKWIINKERVRGRERELMSKSERRANVHSRCHVTNA